MKTLKRLHLKPEQELSDAELKLIKAGGDYPNYTICNPEANEVSECQYNNPCIISIYINDTKLNLAGTCKFGSYKSFSNTCYCLEE